jgi:hypothetical protein
MVGVETITLTLQILHHHWQSLAATVYAETRLEIAPFRYVDS